MSLPKTTPPREVIRRFRELGWEGPYSGKRHQFMVKGQRKVRVPNPHSGDRDVGAGLLGVILDQAGISDDEWSGVG